MKLNYRNIVIILIVITSLGCTGNSSSKKGSSGPEISSTPDTGYTGIKKFYSNDRLVKEVTFKNSIRNGEMKSFYKGGQVYQTFWYENGLREDTSRWYYVDGPVFRTTPYLHDTINGTQIQYYRNGKVKSRLTYIKGLRTTSLEEYTQSGQLKKGYPDITYNLADNYKTSGRVRITLGLTDNSEKVRFYRGDLTGEVVDTSLYEKIVTDKGKATFDLKKSGSPQNDYTGVIAEVITDFGNKYFTYKRITLPYKDLK